MTDKYQTTVIPALPGFDVVGLRFEPYEFSYTPIVAWVIVVPDNFDFDLTSRNEAPYAYPVPADYSPRRDIIRTPDGTIVFAFEMDFPKGQEAEALTYAAKLYEDDLKKRTSAA